MNKNEPLLDDVAAGAMEVDPTCEDWFLQTLVDLANKSPFAVDITLHVGGTLVSGTLASGKDYFEGFSRELESMTKEAAMGRLLRLGFSAYQIIYEQEAEVSADVPLESYIHLRNPKFFNTAGGSLHSEQGTWWRGRISEVQGFILGNVSASGH